MNGIPRLPSLAVFAVTLGLGCSDPSDEGGGGTDTGTGSGEVGDGDPGDGDPGDGDPGDGDGDPGDGDPGDGDPGDGDGDPGDPELWTPGVMFPTLREANARGYLDRRGLIHAHSVHSHDACDGEPKDGMGVYDGLCDRDFREGLCRSRHDFVYLTDHTDSYIDVEYPEALLYRAPFGDELVEVDGLPVANWAGCVSFDAGMSGDAPFVPALLQAGSEAATMPIGLPAHVADTPAERGMMLGDDSPAGIMALADAGAVTLVAHTEDWTVQELFELPLDGFEMYNIHANLFLNIVQVGLLLTKIGDPSAIPHPELVLLPLLSEDPAYVDTWAGVLAMGARKLTTMGTDCHRNSFPQELDDGQRVDSYERLMKWFSNHLLVEPAPNGDPNAPSFGPAQLREALDGHRLFGVFELLGHPQGFDARAEQGAEVYEIGSELSLADGAVSVFVEAPTVRGRDPATEAPIVQLRLLRADLAGWVEVANAVGAEGEVPTLEHAVDEPGAYRAEVRLSPRHLAAWLGDDYQDLAMGSFVWIYANPFYVRD